MNLSGAALITVAGTSKVVARVGAAGPCAPLGSVDGAVRAGGSFEIVPGCALSLSANLKLSPLVTADEPLSSSCAAARSELSAGGCSGWLLAASLRSGERRGGKHAWMLRG